MVYFIYNPNAGNKSNRYRQELINRIQKIPNSTLLLTERPNHAQELIQNLIPTKPDKIIAIGGDGTVNEVGHALLGTNIPLGIIPLGSGNGLARHLGIPMSLEKAIHKAIEGNEIEIDALSWNDRPFFCTAGIGFDAEVAVHFHQGKGRGLFNYIKASIKALRIYKEIELTLESQGKESYFSLTVANANQFGNNAYISPTSNLQDALFEIVKIKKGNLYQIAQLGISLFLKKINKHPLVEIQQANSIEIQALKGTYYHIDGESLQMDSEKIIIKILSAKLKVVC
jgi:YegS/Rv2252/BmrU family lipid kinase